MKKSALIVCLLCVAARAQNGTFTTYTTTWNNLTRQFSVYVPPVLQTAPPLVIALHGSVLAQSSNPPLTVCTKGMGWDALADANGFLLLCPVGTWKFDSLTGGEFFWEAYGTETYFPAVPDDSGFLRSLILRMEKNRHADPARVFVIGFSSGGMMAHRACIDNADLIAACASLSGTVWVGNPNVKLPWPARPVSILEFHGDADPTIAYCGGTFLAWGEGYIPYPAVDVDVNYWLAADGLEANPTPLCVSGAPAPAVFKLNRQSADGKTEIHFARELGYGHTYKNWTIAEVWEFFATHGR